MVKINLLYVFFLLTFDHSLSQNPKHDVGSLYVDVITRRFLELESLLWKEVEENAFQEDKTIILKKIHNEFIKFYSRPFVAADDPRETNHNANQIELEMEIVNADQAVSIVKNQYLQRELDRSLDQKVIDMARSYNTTLLKKLHYITVREDYFLSIKEMKDAKNCFNISGTTMESTSNVLMKQYEMVAKAKLKAYSIPQLSLMILTVYNIENKIEQANALRERFIEQSKLMQKRVRELMSTANREIWMCDMQADFYDEKDNQITHLLEGYVDNEVNLNNEDDCTKTCSHYILTKNYGCYKGTYCEKEEESFSKCKGTIVDCRFIESDFEICPAVPIRERRFESLIYKSGRTLGNPNQCHQPKVKVNSWTRFLVRCHNCFCYCDEPSEKSDRYFSLQPALSDTNQNKIITGVALRKINRIFFWGITQTTLLNNGQLNQTRYYFNSWKRIKEFSITDEGITDGIDYHTLSWRNRSIYLDTLVAPPGYVLTGIRFNSINGHLVLAIRVTRFDFKSGRLFDNFEWISNYNDIRRPILLDRPSESSHRSKTKSIPDTTPNSYIQFQPTDIDKDGAQTTVPYIDVQLVQPPNDKPTLLAGAGIYYKGEPGLGGFIAPKVVTYDYAQHIG